MNRRKWLLAAIIAIVLLVGGIVLMYRFSANDKDKQSPRTPPVMPAVIVEPKPEDVAALRDQAEQIQKIGENLDYFEKRSKYDFEKELDLRIESFSF